MTNTTDTTDEQFAEDLLTDVGNDTCRRRPGSSARTATGTGCDVARRTRSSRRRPAAR
ncbi:hypothetical protein [Streptomyces sp. NPDC002343]